MLELHVGGRNCYSPVDHHRLYNSLLLPHKPWCYMHITRRILYPDHSACDIFNGAFNMLSCCIFSNFASPVYQKNQLKRLSFNLCVRLLNTILTVRIINIAVKKDLLYRSKVLWIVGYSGHRRWTVPTSCMPILTIVKLSLQNMAKRSSRSCISRSVSYLALPSHFATVTSIVEFQLVVIRNSHTF